jgi:hypothetical protein
VLAIAAIPFVVIATLLLTWIFGPSDLGLRCARSGGTGQCEVLQSRFFGLFGNSSFDIDEADIVGAETVRPQPAVGGHAGTACAVALRLKAASYAAYPVLSYPACRQADAAARRLNMYFADHSSSSIEIRDDIGVMWALAAAPMLLIAGVLIARWRVRRHGP